MYYKFSYRRKWFWKSIEVIGHKYEEKQDKMFLFMKDGGIQEIKNWSNCECKLGTDWYKITLNQMETSVGQKIPTKI
jgi:hypothetical protein